MIWWWKYDRNPSGEEYSTCFEIVVGGPSGPILPRRINSSPKAEEQGRAPAPAPAPAPASAPLEASYMSKDAASVPNKEIHQPLQPTTDGYDKLPQKATLADLTTKADEPLSVIPTVGGANQNGNQELLKGYDYINDEQGALAGDAINTEQDKDLTPGPLTTPSQVIQGTLNSTLSLAHNRTAVPSGNSTSTNNSTLVQSTPGTGNITVGIPGFRPQTGHDSNFAGNPVVSSAMGASSIATATLISVAWIVNFMIV